MILEDGVEQNIETLPPEDKGDKGKGGDTVAIPKAEFERLQRQVQELTESERYWATRARGGQAPEPEPEADDEDVDIKGVVPEVTGNENVDRAIFDDPEKWTEALTKGPQAVEKLVKSLGYVRRDEVVDLAAKIASKVADQKIERRVQTMQSDSKLVGDFAELQDPKSELFKATAPIYQELVRMNGGKQTTALLYAAAKTAKLQIDAQKPAKPRNERGQFASDEDDRYDRYDDRKERARAQGSERGRSASIADDDETAMGPEALEICKQMGISPKDYMEQRKALNGGRRR